MACKAAACQHMSQGVMRVLGQDDMSWNGMKKFLGQKTVKENIMAFDCAAITPQIRRVSACYTYTCV